MSSSTSSSRSFVRAFLSLLALGVLLFALLSELLVRMVIEPRDGFRAYQSKFLTTEANTVVFGDSQPANAIEPRDGLENLAYGADPMSNMLEKAKAVIGRSDKTRRVVLQFAPHQVSVYRLSSNRSDHIAELFDTQEYRLAFMRPRFRRFLLAYWETALRSPGLLLEPPEHAQAAVAARGRGLVDLPPDAQQRLAALRVQLQTPLPRSAEVDEAIGRLLSLAKDVQGRGIEVCIVQYPVSSAYRNVSAKVPAFDLVRRLVTERSARAGVKFVDMTDRLPDDMFADSDHLAPWARQRATSLVLDQCFGTRDAGLNRKPQ